jgi:CHAT domain-containing protein/Tfp pilus assembly protein PilF
MPTRRSVLALLVAAGCFADVRAVAPPALLSSAQQDLLKARDALTGPANQALHSGKDDEAAPLMRRILAIERAVFGAVRSSPAGVSWLEGLARLHERREEFDKAIPLRRDLLRLRRQWHGEGDWRVTDARLDLEDARQLARLPAEQRRRLRQAQQWNLQVFHLYRRGRSKEALPLAQKALRTWREVLGERHRRTALGWFNLAAQHIALHHSDQALLCSFQALRLRKETLGEKHPDHASALHNLAFLYDQMGEPRKALPLVQRALRLRQETLGEKHPDYAQSLNSLASLYQDLGAPRLALPLYQQAVRLHKEVRGERHPDYAQSLNSLAMLYKERGEHRLALPLYQQALRLHKEVVGERHPSYATSLSNLAALHQERGEYPLALPLSQQALRLWRDLVGEKHPSYANSLNNLAVLYKEMGQDQRALPLLQQALRLNKDVLGEKHPGYANSLGNLAALYSEMGEHRLALPLYRQALRLRKELWGEKHPAYASSLNSLAVIYSRMGEYPLALSLSQQALRLRRDLLGERHPAYARSLDNLALLYKERGEQRLALPLLQQALRLNKETLGEKHPVTANGLGHLAGLYRDMGRYRQALPLFQQALRLNKEVVGERHPAYAHSLNSLAALYQQMGKGGAGLLLSGQALRVARSHLRDSLSVLSERQRQQLLGKQAIYLEFFLSGAVVPREGPLLSPSALYEHAADFKDATSAGAAEPHLARRLARRQPGLLVLLEELRDTRSQLARLAAQVLTGKDLASWRERFDALDRRRTDLEQQLARKSAAFNQLREKPTAARVSARLPARAALVEFLFYRHFRRPVGKGRWTNERRLLAFVVRANREVVLVQLGNASRIRSAVAAWRHSVAATGSPDAQAAGLLRTRLWQPIAKHLDGIDTVLIAPDGELAALPFAALPGDKPGSFLLERYTFGYLGSGRQLLLPSPEVEGDGMLLLGGIDFGKPRALTDPLARPRHWPALPGADLEARQVESAFLTRFRASRVRALKNRRADRARFLAALDAEKTRRHWRYLHLATHGHFEAPRYALPPAVLGAWSVGAAAAGGLAGLSGSLLATLAAQEPGAFNADRGYDPTGRSYRVDEGNPMLLASLVLAGVNDGREEGYLSAEEIALVDLTGCELAVLSACGTALGRQAVWQSVEGLQRGFHQAGARHVLASLWSVSDPATSLLMEHFYRHLWEKKFPPMQALRQAQLVVLKNPEQVEKRARELHKLLLARGVAEEALAARGIGKKAREVPLTRGAARRSPVGWWAPWVLSGVPAR